MLHYLICCEAHDSFSLLFFRFSLRHSLFLNATLLLSSLHYFSLLLASLLLSCDFALQVGALFLLWFSITNPALGPRRRIALRTSLGE